MGFHKHIHEAITINKRRKIEYSHMSGGKTRFLSTYLITAERLTLPIAKYYDKKAQRFNNEGVMVVKEDFVDMDIPPYDTPVEHRSALKKPVKKVVKKHIKTYLSGIPKSILSTADCTDVYEQGVKLLHVFENLENEEDVNIAMVKHVLESICFIAKNAVGYAEQSEGKTISLSNSLIRLHKFALKNSLIIDVMANKFHQENIGIIVNDMPRIEV